MGFKLQYLCAAALFLCLMKAVNIRAQCTKPFFEGRNVILSASYLSTQSFPDGSTVTFECIIGQKPADSKASRSVTCVGSQWTNLELNCIRKSCGTLPDFRNGRYEGTGILFGDKMTVVCNKGYMLAGQTKERWCRDQGWDGRDPVCVEGCPEPEIPHAIKIGGKSPPYRQGNFIDYKCEEGYTMKGENHIVCSAEGWKPEPPECIGPCSKPVFGGHVTLTKEFRSQTSFPHGSKVTFECNPGHKPDDSTVSKSVTCEETNWTKLLLTCKMEKCQAPPVIENGQIEAVSYKCNDGFFLTGSSKLYCSEDGTFEQDPPKCLGMEP